jgi:sulfoacetaldehyde acetyltransferase
MMADGFTRATGKMSMMVAQNGPASPTSSPGEDRLLEPHPAAAGHAAGGQQDHRPGRLPGNGADGLFEDMVAYQEEVRDPSRMAEVLNRVIMKAKRGSAPAQINIPRDFWTQVIDIELPSVVEFERPAGGEAGHRKGGRAPVQRQVPGHPERRRRGPRRAPSKDLASAGRTARCPGLLGYQHNDAFPGSHPLFAGPLGYNGSKAAMELIAKADVVLALGTRLNPFSTLPGYGIDYWPKMPRSSRSTSTRPHRPDQEGHRGHRRRCQEGGRAILANFPTPATPAARTAAICRDQVGWAQELATMDHEDDDPGTTWNERARKREPN